MRLTKRGVALLAASPVLACGAWLFGLPEAAVLSVGAALLVVTAAVWLRFHSPQIEIQRSALPIRLRVGQPCSVQLSTSNAGRRRTAVLVLSMRVSGIGTIWIHLAPLRRSERNISSYNLPTQQRGRVVIEPTRVEAQDPFGLLSSFRSVGEATSILILPRFWSLSPLDVAVGEQNQTAALHSERSARPSDEFASLRDYLPGDDVRRIHWPSTARAGRPVMRQFENPWQHRTTVLLDLRSTTGFDSAAFERAVSAAASVIELAAREGGSAHAGLIRLVTARPRGSLLLGTEFITPSETLDPLHFRLALAEQLPDAPSPLEILQLLGPQVGGRLIICSGTTTEAEIADLQRGSQRFSSRILLTGSKTPASHDSDVPESSHSRTTNSRPTNSRTTYTRSTQSGWLHLDWTQRAELDRVWAEATRRSWEKTP